MCSAFCRLPLEVLIIILRQAPDLSSIYNFIHASAKASAAFELDPVHILDDTIERSIPDFKHLARMVAILGALNVPPPYNTQNSYGRLTFEMFVDKFKSLDENVLTTAPPSSWAFIAGTPGPRYLLSVAVRIHTLQYLCLTTLLVNIHELIFPTLNSEEGRYRTPRGLNESRGHYSGPGITFEPAAWWSPSYVERYRVERALWKLLVYWNVRSVDPRLQNVEDYNFTQYSLEIQRIRSDLGPPLDHIARSAEVDHMNCVSATIQEAIGDSALEAVFTISKNYHKSQIEGTWSQSSVVLEETAKWRLENPAPVPAKDVRKWWWEQGKRSLFKYNSLYRSSYWYMWYSCAAWDRPRGQRLSLKSRGLYFPDYLDLCLWDRKRLAYLGLEGQFEEDIDPGLGYPKKSHVEICKSNIVNDRWRELFLHELVRPPGGQKYIISDDCRMLIDRWESEIGHHGPHSLKLRLAPPTASN
ncbi:uncharacterized protein TRUGW13939_07687 [Talaromyces rugulosus]|uniref:Uncharacterized protein n=1 Tax=Talaromyces rugulosus TaxID=121627 RepID=A0A7H8R2I2_TALRU|nr:uncharacterized protein TRUGW13939_07687 [Talaromyces rugulosus]QKX60542.1 hypothetical protein TRUGW13939_07687 [Talaromyces rugulosus]